MNHLFLIVSGIFLFCKVSGQIQNQGEPTESFSFVFMNDVHLQPERNVVKSFTKAIEFINRLKPDFIISGGDLIMDANAQTLGRADSLFNIYNATLKLFKMPVYNIIGNHELFGLSLNQGITPEHPLYGKKMFEAKIGKLYQSFTHKGWKFMLLDDVDNSEPRKYKGHVDSVQLQWIKNELTQTDPKTPIVIALHIPVITAWTQIEKGALVANPESRVVGNSMQLLELFKGYNLKLVLQGHIHLFEHIYIQNIQFITGGALSGWSWNGPSRGTPLGFVMINVKNDDFSFNYLDFGWKPTPK